MKYFAILAAIGMGLFIIACSSKKNGTDSKNPDGSNAKKATSISTKALSKKWKQVKSKDSYNNIWNDIDEENRRVILFDKEGSYTEINPGNEPCKGTYTTEGNQVIVEHSCNKVPLTYIVESLEKNSLTLSILGRHGKVFHVYEKVK